MMSIENIVDESGILLAKDAIEAGINISYIGI